MTVAGGREDTTKAPRRLLSRATRLSRCCFVVGRVRTTPTTGAAPIGATARARSARPGATPRAQAARRGRAPVPAWPHGWQPIAASAAWAAPHRPGARPSRRRRCTSGRRARGASILRRRRRPPRGGAHHPPPRRHRERRIGRVDRMAPGSAHGRLCRAARPNDRSRRRRAAGAGPGVRIGL